MKTFAIACLAAVAALVARPAAAHSEPERATAGSVVGFVWAPSPLVHYLANTLELKEHEVLAVINALKAHPLQTSSREELEVVLQPVLTAEQYAHLYTLKPAAELSDELRYLARLY